MSFRTQVWLTIIAFALIAFRFTLPPHAASVEGSYQAIAHLFVGGLFGYGLAAQKKLIPFLLVALLCVAEIGAAIYTRLP